MPFWRRILNCSGESIARHSDSDFCTGNEEDMDRFAAAGRKRGREKVERADETREIISLKFPSRYVPDKILADSL